MKYETTTIKSWDEVLLLKDAWEHLEKLNPQNTIFQSFAWHKAWIEAFRKSSDYVYTPHVITAALNGKVIGLSALVINKSKEVEFMGSPETEYHSFLVDPQYPDLTEHLLAEIFKLNKIYIIKLWELRQMAGLSFKIRQYLESKSLSYSVFEHASYQARYSKKINKSDIKYRSNKLKKLGVVSCCPPSRSPEEYIDTLNLFFLWLEERFDSSISRYRQRQLSNEYKQFCQNLIYAFSAESGGPEAQMLELILDSQVIAIDKIIKDKNTIYGILKTFDPRYSYYSPGSILMQDSMNSWLEEGIACVDFLRGGESYKMRFVNTSLPLLRFTIYKNSFQKYFHLFLDSIKQQVKPIVFWGINLYEKIRKLDYKLLFKKIIFGSLWYSGLASLYQALTKNRSRVLCYHSISDHPLANQILSVSIKTFKKQISYIKKLVTGHWSLVITFDDGYQDNYTDAFHVLKKYNIKASIFPTIQFIEQGFVPGWEDGEANFPALTWEQMQEMHKSGLIDFGSHTMTHPSLSKLSKEQIYQELKNSKNSLEIENCALKIDLITYPFGKKSNYNQDVIQVARELGFKKAYTLEEGTNSSKPKKPLELKRLMVFDEPMFMFKTRVSGIIDDSLNVFGK